MNTINSILINPRTGQEFVDVPPKVAAAYLGVGTPFIYEGLKQGLFPFGVAVQTESGRWSFNIPVERLKAYKEATDMKIDSLIPMIEALKNKA
jgi:hypothetical protein